MAKSQAIQQSLDGQNDVRLSTSPRYSTVLQLTSRDLELMWTIYEFGGVLTTVQLAVLFWPPDLTRRLAHLQLSDDEIATISEMYKSGVINQAVELYKWITRINRMREKGVSKSDIRLHEYLEHVHKADLGAYHQIEALCVQIASTTPNVWIFTWLEQANSLPVAYVKRPQYASEFVSSACKSRLKALAEYGVIEPIEQPTRLSEGRAQSCWFLTRRGRNMLAQMHDVRPSSLDWKPAGAYGTLHLGHRLLLNDLRLAVVVACRDRGYTLKQWVDDNQLKRMLVSEKVKLVRLVRDENTNQRHETVETYALKIPDGYFWIDLGKNGPRHCFVELDNQTLTIADNHDSAKDYAQKIRTMSAFYRSGRYKEIFPDADGYMWYLTVTTGNQRRMLNLKQTTEKVIGLHNKAVDRYWFSTMNQIPTWDDYFASAVFTPIWQRAGQDRIWSLDEPYEKGE
jgi:hypothetical protein